MKRLFNIAKLGLLLSIISPQFFIAHAQGAAFTYQGRPNAGNVPANGIQGLNQKLNEKDLEIQTLKQQNNSLAERLNELETMVKSIVKKN